MTIGKLQTRAGIALGLLFFVACKAGSSTGTGGEGAGAGPFSASTSVSASHATNGSTFSASTAMLPSGAGGANECPTDEPADATSCIFMGAACGYGTSQCTCDQKWSCTDCPDTMPATSDACSKPGSACAYGLDTCMCEVDGWDCGTCPIDAPMNNAQCDHEGVGCDYGAGHCQCTASQWVCATPCPATQPTPGSACVGGGATICSYDMHQCACLQNLYFCT